MSAIGELQIQIPLVRRIQRNPAATRQDRRRITPQREAQTVGDDAKVACPGFRIGLRPEDFDELLPPHLPVGRDNEQLEQRLHATLPTCDIDPDALTLQSQRTEH